MNEFFLDFAVTYDWTRVLCVAGFAALYLLYRWATHTPDRVERPRPEPVEEINFAATISGFIGRTYHPEKTEGRVAAGPRATHADGGPHESPWK